MAGSGGFYFVFLSGLAKIVPSFGMQQRGICGENWGRREMCGLICTKSPSFLEGMRWLYHHRVFTLFFKIIIIFNWSTVALQYCVTFCYTAR